MKDCWASAAESPETLPQPLWSLTVTTDSPDGLGLWINPWIWECPVEDAAPLAGRGARGPWWGDNEAPAGSILLSAQFSWIDPHPGHL